MAQTLKIKFTALASFNESIQFWLFKINFDLQDVFAVFPGDTDYRMFATDYGDIPGLDIIFLLGGYYYHTSFDTVDRLLYESIAIFSYRLLNFSFSCIFFVTA